MKKKMWTANANPELLGHTQNIFLALEKAAYSKKSEKLL